MFQLPHKVDEYKVEAYIEGAFYPDDPNKETTPIEGILVTEDRIELPAFMSLNCWKKIQQRKDFNQDKSYYWFLHFQTKRNKEISEAQLIRPKIDKPYLVDFGGEIFNAKVDYFRIRGQISAIYKNSFSVRIECKTHYEKDVLYKPFTIKIDGTLPTEANPGDFWEVVGVRNGKVWVLQKAEIADEAKLTEFKINRRDFLRELLLEKTEMEVVPSYLKERINPTQIKKMLREQTQPKKKKKKKKKKLAQKIRPVKKEKKTLDDTTGKGKIFRLY
ncbi:MAG: hypothetical protein WBM32_10175 [Crocosphaera sp.]